MISIERLAEKAYFSHRAHIQRHIGVNPRRWKDLGPGEQKSWIAAVETVREELFKGVVKCFRGSVDASDKQPAEQPIAMWMRDDESTFIILSLVSDTDVSKAQIAGWTDAQCRQAEEWAFAIHFSASDNDDVVVPERPDFLDAREMA